MADIVLTSQSPTTEPLTYTNGYADNLILTFDQSFVQSGNIVVVNVDETDTITFAPALSPNLYQTGFLNDQYIVQLVGGARSVFRGDGTNVNVCFTRGAMVATPDGPRAIESLGEGDLVLTRDRGAQPIRWIGSTRVSAETLSQFPEKRPVTIAAGTFGNHEATTVSPAHRILVTGWRAEALFGTSEVLAAAQTLIDDVHVTRSDMADVEYFHMMFESHEIVMVDGLWSESFHPGAIAQGLDAATRDEVLELFPELEAATATPAARPALTALDVSVIL